MPNTTYYFQAIGSVNGAAIYGGQQQFTTTGSSTLLTTNAATNITTTSAVLNATVTSGNTILTSLAFNWGTTTSYGNTLSGVPSSAGGNTAISAALSGLQPNTTYYYQATGIATGNTIYANQQQFTTDATGIATIGVNDINVSIYPNPAKQQFIINTHTSDTYTVDMYNMIGEKVLGQVISQPVTTMQVSTLANGIYNVVVKKDNAVKTYRLVVLNE